MKRNENFVIPLQELDEDIKKWLINHYVRDLRHTLLWRKLKNKEYVTIKDVESIISRAISSSRGDIGRAALRWQAAHSLETYVITFKDCFVLVRFKSPDNLSKVNDSLRDIFGLYASEIIDKESVMFKVISKKEVPEVIKLHDIIPDSAVGCVYKVNTELYLASREYYYSNPYKGLKREEYSLKEKLSQTHRVFIDVVLAGFNFRFVIEPKYRFSIGKVYFDFGRKIKDILGNRILHIFGYTTDWIEVKQEEVVNDLNKFKEQINKYGIKIDVEREITIDGSLPEEHPDIKELLKFLSSWYGKLKEFFNYVEKLNPEFSDYKEEAIRYASRLIILGMIFYF